MPEDVTLLVEQRNQPVVDAVDHAGVPGKATRGRGLTRLVGANVGGQREEALTPQEGGLGQHRVAPEEEGEHVDVRQKRGHQNHGNVRGVDQTDGILPTVATHLAVRQRQLKTAGFGVGDHKEHHHRREQRCDRIHVCEQDGLETVHRHHLLIGRFSEHVEDHRQRPCRRVLNGVRHACGRGQPGEGTHEGGLGHTCGDEQRDTGTNAPFADQFVEQEHEVGPSEQLCNNHRIGPTQTVRVDEELSRVEETVGLRDRLDGDHDEDEQFLHALVHRLVFAVGQVKTDDLRTCEQLHDDGAGHDGTNAEVHDGTGGTGHDGAETAEQVERLPRKAEQQHVGHREVNAEHQEGGRDLVAEADVVVGLLDGGVDVDKAVQCVETAALVAFVEEARDGGCSAKS